MKYFLSNNSIITPKWLVVWTFLLIAVAGTGQPAADPFLAARACMEKELYDSALIHLRSALNERRGDADLLYHIGVANYKSGTYPAAGEAFREVERRRPGLASLYLARIEARLGHPEQALKYLKVHLDSRYRKPEEVILLDSDLAVLEDHPGWQKLWNEKEWYGPSERKLQEARFLKGNGRELEAINLLNELEKEGFNRSEVLEEKADIYSRLGNAKAAKSALEAAVRSDVRNLDALQKLSAQQVEEGSAGEAVGNLNRLIRQEPDRFKAYLLRAEAYSRLGDLEAASRDMSLYLTYFPEDDAALYRKGTIEFTHGKYLDALESFNKALSINDGVADYYHARGKTYASTNLQRYAEKDLSMALDLNPYEGTIWYDKGLVSERLGNPRQACHCYRKALRYGVYDAREKIDEICR